MSVGTQGVVDIVTFLLREYAKHLGALHQEPYEKAKERVLSMDQLSAFREFCYNFLSNNRPATISHAEANYIIQFTGGQLVAVCPAMERLKGTMQASSYIPVTGRETALEIMRNANGMRGEMTPMGGTTDMTQGEGPVDMTQPQGPKRYDL